MLKLLKFLACLVVIIVVVLTVITFGGGPYIRNYLNTHGAELLGRRVQVGKVRLNGFTGSLSVDSLFIAEQDDTTRFVSAKQIKTHLNVPRIFLKTYMLDELEADELQVDILQRDTVFNFSDIIERLALDEENDNPLPLVVKDINIHNSYIHYKDSLVGSDFSLNDFQLFIPGIDFRDINTSVGISLSFTNGGTLKTKVDYDDKHKLYSTDIKIDGFNLQGLLPYFRQTIYLGDLKGVLNLDLVMHGSVAHLLDFSLKGKAGIKGLNVLDEEGMTMVRCDTVDIDVRDMDLPANRINLSRVHFERPYIRIQYDKDSLDNFTRLVRKAEQIWAERDSLRLAEQGLDYSEVVRNAEQENVLAEESSVEFNGRVRQQHLQIDTLLIDSARLSYRDESLRYDPFVYELTNVNIKAPNFSLHDVNHITADAQLGREGHLKFWYDGRTVDQRDMHMVVQAEKIDVKDFSPYTVQMFGNEVSSGTMSANLMYDTKNGRLLGQNHIIVRNPKVEKKRRGVQAEMNIPFRSGVYILTDKNDVLDIDLPIRGDIEDPRFSYKRLLFRTMGKFIVKVCSSPFRRNKNHASNADILRDTRNLDDIDIDSISSDLLQEE
ncbi:MAG: DUF748 domain-containing protein [Bacteroidales bacterium]|nr:DUF748 domain-containing protein [Bacteroidales bacterium]